jgi:hypothetical protein
LNWFSYSFCVDKEKADVSVREAGMKSWTTVWEGWRSRAEALDYGVGGWRGRDEVMDYGVGGLERGRAKALNYDIGTRRGRGGGLDWRD